MTVLTISTDQIQTTDRVRVGLGLRFPSTCPYFRKLPRLAIMTQILCYHVFLAPWPPRLLIVLRSDAGLPRWLFPSPRMAASLPVKPKVPSLLLSPFDKTLNC